MNICKSNQDDMLPKMNYLVRLCLSLTFLILCFTCSTPLVNIERADTQNEIEGVYEFISEKNEFTIPKKNVYERTYPEWSGMWIFKDGHFSRVTMKSRSNFQKNSKRELEYLSEAGDYKILEGKLEFRIKFAYFAYDLQSLERFEFNLNKNILTLTRYVPVSVENLYERKDTIILRKIKGL